MALLTKAENAGEAVSPHEARDHRRRPRSRWPIALVVGAASLSATGAARAATYKWVDEKGVVHYTDKMPPEAVDKANVRAQQARHPDQARPTRRSRPEQRRANEQEVERARTPRGRRRKSPGATARSSSSYTSEAEIDLARNRSLQTINNVILSSQAFSEQLTKRKVDVEAKKVESQGKPVVAVLDRELESIDAELARQSELVAQKKREVAAITAKYDADKQRWRELSATKRTRSTATASRLASATPVASRRAAATGRAVAVAAGTAKK